MKKLKRNKAAMILGALGLVVIITGLILVYQPGNKEGEKTSTAALNKENKRSKNSSSAVETMSKRKPAGRDSFPTEEAYESYKKMLKEAENGEVIVSQLDPDVPNRKAFIGSKSEFVIENWSVENYNAGGQLLKVPFTFKNKTSSNVDLNEYLKNRVTAQQVYTESRNSFADLVIEEYPGQIKVGANESYSGFLYIQILDNKPNSGITFNISYVSGGANNKGGGVILHDLNSNPSF